MSAIIRKATIDDLGTIQQLNSELFEHDRVGDSFMNFEWPFQEAGAEYFRKRIEGDGLCLLAEVDGKAVGYICGAMKPFEAWDTTVKAELENMYVVSEHRGQGIGGLLASELMNWCRESGARHVTVNAFWYNESAVGFYERMGFQKYSVALRADLEEVNTK